MSSEYCNTPIYLIFSVGEEEDFENTKAGAKRAVCLFLFAEAGFKWSREMDNEKRRKSQLEELKQDEMVLFLGAGVNYPLLPTWSKLLGELLEEAIYYGLGTKWERKKCKSVLKWAKNPLEEGGLSPYAQASLIRRLLGAHYLHAVHQKLYAGVDDKFDEKCLLLNAIAKLCNSEKVRAVVSYNYDDLLETVIERKHGRVQRIYGKRMPGTERGHLPVYHVHGCLPWKGSIQEYDEEGIVLCYEEYYRSLLEPYSWKTVEQLSLLRTYTALYLGISLTDMNMLRLLTHAAAYTENHKGYILWCGKDMHAPDDKEGQWSIWRSLCEDLGLEMLYCGPEYRDILTVVRGLARSC